MKWKSNEQGQQLWLGGVKVAGVYWDGLRSKDDPNKYAISCRLPGVKLSTTHFPTMDTAKRVAELAVAQWLADAGLEQTDPAKTELAKAARSYVFAMRDGPVLPRDHAHQRLVEANKQWPG